MDPDASRESSETSSALGEVWQDLRRITTGLRLDNAGMFATNVDFFRLVFCAGSRLLGAVPVADASVVGVGVALILWTVGSGIRIRVIFKDDGSAGVAPGFSALGFLRIEGSGVRVRTLCAAEGKFSDKAGLLKDSGGTRLVFLVPRLAESCVSGRDQQPSSQQPPETDVVWFEEAGRRRSP